MIVAVVRNRAAPAIERANEWLTGRSERERLLLGFLTALGIGAIGWYGIIQPLLISRQTAVERIELYESLQARLRAAPPGAVPASGTVPITGPLDEAVRKAGAEGALAVQVVGGADRVSVTVTGARFDSAVPFVRALESGGAVVEDLRMETGSQPGLINLTLTATRP